MEIKTATARTDQLTDELLRVWEASVRATHHFLDDDDIVSIHSQVRQALTVIADLVYTVDGKGRISGFMAVENGKIEMLFIHPDHRGHGLGKAFVHHAADLFHASRVDVNEQNVQGIGFYTYMGFKVVDRSCVDGNGNPFPLLHMGR